MPEQHHLQPLAVRMRPATLERVVGQDHLLGNGRPLRRMVERRALRSMIFWGPPGVGKTTIAQLLAAAVGATFTQLSAVSAGVKDVRAVLEQGKLMQREGQQLVLFLDEIHRFNKAQQDALLQGVEEGWVTLIGATTENPSFEVIAPLLSRSAVFKLHPLTSDALDQLIDRAFAEDDRLHGITLQERDLLKLLSGGDGRKLLTGLELSRDLLPANATTITDDAIRSAFSSRQFYDKAGEMHYDTISAFIKSIRGSDPDAALFYLARMIESGEDPLFIARRLIILASEDIGNADPYGITLATNVMLAVERVGMPEGRIILAQGVTWLAAAQKSNAAYMGIEAALKDARDYPHLAPPLHIRNAPTGLMKSLGYGKGYRYPHQFAGGFVEQEYFPEELRGRVYYRPTENGGEKKIHDRLLALRPTRYHKQ
ncbi:MAG: replication-associated recombination protein A [Armatimonadetes bacterium]|nr:replication-associated recombination protein A [Armatimonadota bacterium]